MAELDSGVRELLDRWAASPVTPMSELTAEAVRGDDLAVLDLQRGPGELYSVEDVEAPGPADTLAVRVYRPRPERLQTVLFLHLRQPTESPFSLSVIGYQHFLRMEGW